MGGDDSQKLRPWRGATPLRGTADLRVTVKSRLYRKGRSPAQPPLRFLSRVTPCIACIAPMSLPLSERQIFAAPRANISSVHGISEIKWRFRPLRFVMRTIILFFVSCLGLAGVSVALAQEASRPELKLEFRLTDWPPECK